MYCKYTQKFCKYEAIGHFVYNNSILLNWCSNQCFLYEYTPSSDVAAVLGYFATDYAFTIDFTGVVVYTFMHEVVNLRV